MIPGLRLKGEHDLRTARRARLGARNLIGIRTQVSQLIAGTLATLARRFALRARSPAVRFLRAVSAAAKVNDPLDRRETFRPVRLRAQIDHCGWR
jgi:hypothetical protein